MRRVISFILVLALVFSLSCVAFAFHRSHEGGGDSDHCHHEFEDGVCKHCGWACRHEYVGGVCQLCGKRKPLIVNGNPSTGDVIMFWVAVMLVSAAAMGGMVVIYRKKFRR